MKFCLQLNPQVAVDKPAASLLPTLIEQVRIADAVGFDAFSMGDHYNIPGLQRLNQVPALARLCAEAKLYLWDTSRWVNTVGTAGSARSGATIRRSNSSRCC